MNKPKISIITVSYNAANTIEQTILSVISQTYENIEYIIIDGGSTDGTVDIIKKYEDKIAYWVSEPDEGIYDAMNKGIDVATGEWIYFIGADDCLLEIPEDDIENYSYKNIGLIYGNVILSNNKIFKSKWNWKLKLTNTIHHQGVVISSELLKKFKYDLSFKIYSDFDLNQKFYKRGCNVQKTDILLAKFNLKGRSSKGGFCEIAKITHKNFGIFYVFLSFIYHCLNEFRNFTCRYMRLK